MQELYKADSEVTSSDAVNCNWADVNSNRD